jgi:TPR repeat protein
MKIIHYIKCLLAASLFAAASVAMAGGSYGDGTNSALQGDYRSAFATWQSLAENGDGRAQFNLGLMYHGGLFVAADEEKALDWYRRAAENGVPEAQQFLAVAYTEGWFGLQQNMVYAQYWTERLNKNIAN